MKYSCKHLLLCSVTSLISFSHGQALAAPQGGSVAAGNATISQSGKKTDIHQSSNKAILDWSSFDIGADEHTQFHQPSSGSVTLNRIHDTKASQIDGKLTANGHVMLINQNGVVFGGGAQVDVGSLTVSTADIDNDDFMAGNMDFKHAGKSNAAIVNHGHITAKEAGLVNLVAPKVENHGVIAAKLGKVQLAAADTFTLDMAGDGLIQVAVSDEEAKKLATNTGRISAEGGYVAITAGRARNIVDSIVDNSGVIEAHSMTNVGGKIVLSADHGITKMSGTMNASGLTGGGSIKIGGDYQGKGEDGTVNSVRTLVSEDAVINASATETGSGGEVIVWADERTYFYGDIDASGVESGGFAEVSGKQYLDFNGDVDLSGAVLGTLLLDPDDLDIVAGSANPGEFADDQILFAENSGGTSTIGADTISGRLTSNANVILQANNTIDVDAAITSSGSGDLTLQTGLGGTLTVNAAIDVNAGDLTLEADNMDINANLSGSGDLTVRQVATDGRQTLINHGVDDGSSLHLSSAEVGYFVDGWNQINIGRSDMVNGNTSNRAFFGGAGDVTFHDDLNLLQRSQLQRLTLDGGSSVQGNVSDIFIYVTTDGGDFSATYGAVYGAGGTITTNGGDVTLNDLSTWNSHPGLTINTSGGDIAIEDIIESGGTPSGVRAFDLDAGTGDITITGTANTQASITMSASDIVLGGAWGGSVAIGDVDITASNTASLVDITASNITLGGAGTFSSGGSNATLTTDTGGAIALNAALNTGAGDLTLKADEIDINANLSGGGDIQLTSADVSQEIEIGSTDASDLNLTATELGFLQDGWNSITIGDTDHNAAIRVNEAVSFSDHTHILNDLTTAHAGEIIDVNASITTTDDSDLYLYSRGSGSSVHPYDGVHVVADLNVARDLFISTNSLHDISLVGSATVTVGRDFDLQVGKNAFLNSDFTVGGDLTIVHSSTNSSHQLKLGAGSVAGDVSITGLDKGIFVTDSSDTFEAGGNIDVVFESFNIQNSFTANGAGDITLTGKAGGATFISGSLNSGSGDLTILAEEIDLSGNLSGTGDVRLSTIDATQEIEIGSTDASDLNLTATELGFLQDGWNSITIGDTDHTGAIEITDAVSFSDDVNFFNTGDDATIIVAGAFTTTDGASAVMASGTAANVGWDAINIDADMNVAGDLTLRTGDGVGQGHVDVNNSNMSVGGNWLIDSDNNGFIDSTNINVGGNLSGVLSTKAGQDVTTYRVITSSATIGGDLTLYGHSLLGLYGDFNVTGDVTLDNSAKAGQNIFMQNGTMAFGGNLNVLASNNLTIGNADLDVDGSIDMESTAIAINGSTTISGNADGSSTITFKENGEDDGMEFGGTSAGHTWNMSQAEIDKIQDGFSSITFGSTAMTGDIYFSDDVSFTDNVTFRQDQASAASINGENSIVITTTDNADASFYNGDNFAPTWDLTSYNIAGDGLWDNFGGVSFINSTIGGDVTVDARNSFGLHSGVTANIGGDLNVVVGNQLFLGYSNAAHFNVEGDIDLESGVVSFYAGSTISGNADGSSTITFKEYGEDDGMELGGTTVGHTWNMSQAEIDTIQNGFSSITFGSTAMTGGVEISDDVSFTDDVVFRQDQANAVIAHDFINSARLTVTDGGGATFYGDNSLSVNLLRVTTDGDLLFDGFNTVTMQSSTIGGDLTIQNNSGNSGLHSGATVNVSGDASFYAPDTFQLGFANTATLNVDGDIEITSGNVDFYSTSVISGNADGSSTITFKEYGEDDGMEFGGTSAGHTWNMSQAEIDTIQDGFSSITFGSTSMAGDIDITGAVSFVDNVNITQDKHEWNAALTISDNLTLLDNANLNIISGREGTTATGDINVAGNFDFFAMNSGSFEGVAVGGDLDIDTSVDLNLSDTTVGGDADIVASRRFNLKSGHALSAGGDLSILSGPFADGKTTLSSNTSVSADGNIVFESASIDISANATISGNADGSSTITFKEYGENDGMELSGTTVGHAWNMSQAEIDTIQDGFSSITFGSTSHTQAIEITDAVSFSDDVNFYNTGADSVVNVTGTLTTTDGASVVMETGTAANNSNEAINLDADIDIAGNLTTRTGDGTGFGIVSADNINIDVGGDWLILTDYASVFAIDDMNIGGNLTGLSNNGLSTSYYFDVANNAIIGGNLSLSGGRALRLDGDFDIAGDLSLIKSSDHSQQGMVIREGAKNIGGTLNVLTANGLSLEGDVTVDGNIDITSSTVAINTTSTISGNVDGSSTITFLEYGEDGDMEIGAALTGATWQMDDAELATIDRLFNKVTFGSSSMTGDVVIDGVNLQAGAKDYDLEVFANDITVKKDGSTTLRRGAGNTYLYALDAGVDKGDINFAGYRYYSALAGELILQADNDIIMTAASVTAFNNALDITFNADRNADQSGAIYMNNAHLNTNGGNFVAGGGLDPTTTVVYGNATYNEGVHLENSSIRTEGGDISIRGNGWDDNAAGNLYGIYAVGSTIETTTGDITLYGNAGDGDGNGLTGVQLSYNTDITTDGGDISVTGIGGTGAGDYNRGVNIIGTVLTAGSNGAITIDGTSDETGTDAAGVRGQQSGNTASLITIGSGDIIINSNGMINFGAGGVIGGGSASGDIYFNTENIKFSNAPDISTTGDIYITPRTSSTSIAIAGGTGTLNIDDAELALLNAGGKLVIGDSANGTGDIDVNSWDLSSKDYDVEIHGGVIDLGGITMGAGSFLAHANGARNVSVSDDVLRTATGDATLDIRADRHVNILSNADITSTNGSLNVILNADRDGNQSGAVDFYGTNTVTTNGGDFIAGGGADPMTSAAYGNAGKVVGVTLETTQVNTGAGDIVINGQGHSDNAVDDLYGVYLDNSSLQTTTGDITLNGTGGDGNSGNAGIYLDGAGTLITSQDGDILLTGQGGDGAGGSNTGIELQNSAQISSTGNNDLTAGTITLNGTGAGDFGGTGIDMRASSSISSIYGDIQLTGTGDGNIGGQFASGIDMLGGSTINSTGANAGAANITLTGTGATLFGSAHGVFIRNHLTSVNSDAGDISITGDSHNNSSAGVYISGHGITSTSGDVTIDGTSNASNSNAVNAGIYIDGRVLTDGSADIILTGQFAGSGSGTDIKDSSSFTRDIGGVNALGDITINADTVDLSDLNIQTSGDITLTPRTNGTTIGLGGGAGMLNLDDTEMASFDAASGNVYIGNALSGDINIDTLSLAAANYDLTLRGSNITSNGITLGANDINLVPVNSFTNTGGASGISGGSGRFLIYAASPLSVTKDGLSASELYERTYALNPPSSITGGSAFVFASDTPPAPPPEENVRDALTPSVEQQIIFNTQNTFAQSGTQFFALDPTVASLAQSFEPDASIRMIDADLLEVQPPVAQYYDLCSYNSKYCN